MGFRASDFGSRLMCLCRGLRCSDLFGHPANTERRAKVCKVSLGGIQSKNYRERVLVNRFLMPVGILLLAAHFGPGQACDLGARIAAQDAALVAAAGESDITGSGTMS